MIVCPVCINWDPEKGFDLKEFRMSESMVVLNFVIGITTMWLWMFSLIV